MRNEGWDQGIRVTAICPGWVNTDMAKDINQISKEEMTQPIDIANICSNLLKLPNSSIPFEISASIHKHPIKHPLKLAPTLMLVIRSCVKSSSVPLALVCCTSSVQFIDALLNNATFLW